MLVQLEVIVNSTIKRKKPWPRLSFVGEARQSVYLLDKTRLSQLYLPSGKTKKVIASLKTFTASIICINISKLGNYVIGILKTGKIFLWHKDSGKVTNVESCPAFTAGTATSCDNIFVNEEGNAILLCVNSSTCFLWVKRDFIGGNWHSLSLGSIPLPAISTRESDSDCVFVKNESIGWNIFCSTVSSNHLSVSIATIHVDWNRMNQENPINVKYGSIQHDIRKKSPSRILLKCKGTYLSSWSHKGTSLAIAVNQRHPKDNCIIFANASMDTVIEVSLASIYQQKEVISSIAKSYWISQIAWMNDDVFLACITRRGSLLMLSRLGEPVLISTKGLHHEYGPQPLIPLLPLAQYDSGTKAPPGDVDELSTVSSTASERIWKKRFSIAAHPRLPVLLLSNGFSVIGLRTTGVINAFDVSTLCLAEATKLLHGIAITHHIEVKFLKGLLFLLPKEEINDPKFKEDRMTVILNNIKKKFSGKQQKSDKQIGTSGGGTPLKEVSQNKANTTGTIAQDKNTEETAEQSFNFKFEDYMDAFETTSYHNENDSVATSGIQLDTDSPLGTQEFNHKPGVILNADAGKITFGDLEGTSLAPTVHKTQQKRITDGETLLKQLSDCKTMVLTALAYLLTSDTFSAQNTKKSTNPPAPSSEQQELASDEMQSFFLSTFQYYCSVVKELQTVADLLQFSSKASKPLRTLLCEDIVSLGRSVSALSAFDKPLMNHSKTLSRAVEISVSYIMKSTRTAHEGCVTPEDVFDNILSSFLLLVHAEKQMNIAYSFGESIFVDTNISSDSVVVTDAYRPLFLQSSSTRRKIETTSVTLTTAWRKLSIKLMQLINTKQPPQVEHLLRILLRQLQKHTTLLHPVPSDKTADMDRLTLMTKLLSRYDIRNAVSLARASIHNNLLVQKKWKDNTWIDVELLCSVMSLYFCGQPVHLPCDAVLQSASTTVASALLNNIKYCKESNHYCKLLDKNRIVVAIRQLGVEDLWTSDHAIELLLDCGRLEEAVLISSLFGDWRSAVVLAAAMDKVNKIPLRNQRKLPLAGNPVSFALNHCAGDTSKLAKNIPNLLKHRLYEVVKQTCAFTMGQKPYMKNSARDEIEDVCWPITDVCMIAVMSGIDMVSWTCLKLLDSLKYASQDAHLLIQDDFYLPAPPFHLPQMISPRKDEGVVKLNEAKFRKSVSSVFRCLFSTFHASKLTALCSSWYLRKLEHEFVENAEESFRDPPFAETMRDINQLLTKADQDTSLSLDSFPLSPHPNGCNNDAYVAFSCFRETCALLWMFHVRDNISISLRKYQTLKENETLSNTELFDAIHECLKWLELMRPFQQYLFCEAEIQDLVLCLAMDLPVDTELVKLIALYCNDTGSLNAKVDVRLNQLKQKIRSDGVSGEELLQMLDEECKRIKEDRDLHQLFVLEDHNKLETIKSMSSTYIPFSARDSDTASEKEFMKTYMIGKSQPDNLLNLLNTSYSFENEPLYHTFIEDVLSIVLDKAAQLLNPSQRKSAKRPNNILPPLYYPLILSFRKQVANMEINAVDMEQQYNNTTIIQNTTLSKSTLEKSPALPSKTSAPTTSNSFNQEFLYFSKNEEGYASTTLKPIASLPVVDVRSLPTVIQKKLTRLSPYFEWLAHWKNQIVPKTKIHEGSIRVNLTSEKLMHGFVMSELRFGKWKMQSVAQSSAKQMKPVAEERSVTTENEETSDKQPLEVTQDDQQEEEKEATLPPLSPVPEEETKAEAVAIEENKDEVDNIPQQEEAPAPSGGIFFNKGKQEEEPTTEEKEANEPTEPRRELPRDVAPDLSDVASTGLQSDIMADGGGRLRRQHLSSPPKRENITSIVQSEIQNVLLAQQVQLLSQILLGQTVPGANSQVNSLLSNLQQNVQSHKPPAPSAPPSEPEEYVTKYKSPAKMLPAKHFGIPLLRMSGITKSADPKSVLLPKTPDSKRAWAASEEARDRSMIMDAPPPPSFAKLIKLPGVGAKEQGPVEYDHHTHTHYVPDRSRPPIGQQSIPVRHNIEEYDVIPTKGPSTSQQQPTVLSSQPDVQPSKSKPLLKYPYETKNLNAYTHQTPGPTSRGIYQTKFPIISTSLHPPAYPVQPPQFASMSDRPHYQPSVLPLKTAWPESRHAGRMYGPPVQGHGVVPRLIDPREVLAYENSKRTQMGHGFQAVRGSKPINPPMPILQAKAPLFDVTMEPVAREPTIAKETVPPTQASEPRATTHVSFKELENEKEREHESGGFDGHLDQGEVNNRFENAAALHYMASVNKQQSPVKPRMKSSQQQTEPIATQTQDATFDVPHATTQPIKNRVPPDIFLKLRFSDQIGTQVTTDDYKDRFINVGDVDAQSVMHGIEIAQAEQRSESETSQQDYDPGFPMDDVTANSILSQHVKDATKVGKLRTKTRNDWSAAMIQMDEQLSAIDEMARDMKHEFKGSNNLIRTIDQLTDAMDHQPTVKPRSITPPPSRSYSDITMDVGFQPPREVTGSPIASRKSPVSTRSKSPVLSVRSRSPMHSGERTPQRLSKENSFVSQRSTLSDISNTYKSRMKPSKTQPVDGAGKMQSYISRVDEALRLASWNPDELESDAPPAPEREFHISAPYSGTNTPQMRSSAHSSMRSYEGTLTPERSAREELADLMSDLEPDLPIKSWKKRTVTEKEDIRQWMESSRRKRNEEYKKKVNNLRSAEKHPFTPSKSNARRVSDSRKRQQAEEHRIAREVEAQMLLDELRSEKPNLPASNRTGYLATQPQKKRVGISRGYISQPYQSATPHKAPYKARVYANTSKHLPVSSSRRHQITASGIPSEKSPRSSRNVKSSTANGRVKHTDAYRKPGYRPPTIDELIPTLQDTLQKISLHQKAHGGVPEHDTKIKLPEDRLSDVSGLSNWSLSDDVKELLYGTPSGRKPRGKGVTFDLGRDGDLEQFLPQNSISLKDLGIGYNSDVTENTESLLADADWKGIENLIATEDPHK